MKNLKKTIGCIGCDWQILDLGLTKYADALNLQRQLVRSRSIGLIEDTLVLLEHPAVITMGKSGREEDLLVELVSLQSNGIEFFYCDRGGGITVHSPGQLVGYPILNLVSRRMDLHAYIYWIEETIIRTLLHFQIHAEHVTNFRGVWVGGNKICSIGAKCEGSITFHGFALNVNNDLNYFSYICPCGIQGVNMISISKILGVEITTADVKTYLVNEFLKIFKLDQRWPYSD